MELRGKITGLTRDFKTHRLVFSVEVSEGNPQDIEAMRDKDASITVVDFRKHRSKNANALMWSCLSKIASSLGGKKEDYYLQALRKYGKFTLVSVKKDAFDAWKKMWRECEKVGERGDVYDVLCYFGSSTYDTKEFAVLLDGIIDDMKVAGIETPTQEELERSLALWERSNK